MTSREFKREYWYPVSVDIERALRKIRIRIDRAYRKKWPIVFACYVMFLIGVAIIPIVKDTETLIERIKLNKQIEYTLDEPFSDRYQHWRTEGNPGQDPPKS